MKVVGIAPRPEAVTIVAAESAGTSVMVPFKDEWKMATSERADWYVEIRTRLVERLGNLKPDEVAIVPIETMATRHGVKAVTFGTAELRGVLAEAARSTGVTTSFRNQAAIGRSMNPPRKKGDPAGRKASEIQEDDAFWAGIAMSSLEKKYRQAALLAISVLFQEQSE